MSDYTKQDIKNRRRTIITIDGPSGCGKSSVSASLARKLKFIHLNSGLLYRVIAKASNELNSAIENPDEIAKLLEDVKFDFNLDSGDFRTHVRVKFVSNPSLTVYFGGLNFSELYDELTTKGASLIATYLEVRRVLSDVQRAAALEHDMVLEGRDAGTVVFPDANFKFYLDASLEERALRRFLQAKSLERTESNISDALKDKSFEDLKQKLSERDKRDSTRSFSPLRIADDAEVINTDLLSEQEVVELLYSKVACD